MKKDITIEEIVEEFANLPVKGLAETLTWLEQTLQTERQRCDEMVEAERERINKVVNELRPILWNDNPEKHASNIRLTNNLNIIAEALTTPLTDKVQNLEEHVQKGIELGLGKTLADKDA